MTDVELFIVLCAIQARSFFQASFNISSHLFEPHYNYSLLADKVCILWRESYLKPICLQSAHYLHSHIRLYQPPRNLCSQDKSFLTSLPTHTFLTKSTSGHSSPVIWNIYHFCHLTPCHFLFQNCSLNPLFPTGLWHLTWCLPLNVWALWAAPTKNISSVGLLENFIHVFDKSLP